MQSNIQIKNEAERCVIDIEGTIGIPEEWQFEHPDQRVATYEKFRETVRAIAGLESGEVVVNIRSTGGDVNDALLIYEALRETGARIVTRCYGYTASAATLIAQAASEGCRELAPGALYLIHNSLCAVEGNAEELSAQTELLRKTDARLAELYAARSGRSSEEFALLMAENNGRGRWLSPEETVAAGLADTIVGAEEKPAEQKPKNAVRGWEKLLTHLGIRTPAPPQLPKDRNVLHFDDDHAAAQRRSEVAAEEAFLHAGPTRVLPCDDPGYAEAVRSANQRAYDADARQFRK